MLKAPFQRDLRVNYHADGTARDTYVQSGNGGLVKPYSPVKAPPVTTFGLPKIYQAPSPVLRARGVYYHSDGKGRDHYIETNSGGLNGYGNLFDSTENFKRSLRAESSCSPYRYIGRSVVLSPPKRKGDVHRSLDSGASIIRKAKKLNEPDPFLTGQMTFTGNFRATQSAMRRY